MTETTDVAVMPHHVSHVTYRMTHTTYYLVSHSGLNGLTTDLIQVGDDEASSARTIRLVWITRAEPSEQR